MKSTLHGTAAVFWERSIRLVDSDGRPYYEVIEPGFFDNVLTSDVRCCPNHNFNLIVGRSTARTLRLRQDGVGLHYECDLDQRQSYVRDLEHAIKRGDVSHSSFRFRADPSKIKWVNDGKARVRYLQKGGCVRLIDVSPVTYPAYKGTSCALRTVNAARSSAAELLACYNHVTRHLDLDLLEC